MMLGKTIDVTMLRYRPPSKSDGAAIWRMVKDSGKLDLNSSYYYLLMSHWFSDSCRLVEDPRDNHLIGIATGFRQPAHPDTLFVWQIAVDDDYRGRGIATRLLDEQTANPEIQFVEATISPSNRSSKRLFEKWAAARQASLVITEGFNETLFPNHPDQQHEREDLFRIGPLGK